MSDIQPAPATEAFEVRNRWTGNLQFTAQIQPGLGWRLKIGAALKWAISSDAVLRGAVLRGADLHGADLRGADLHGADLRDADLRGADLRDAVLSGADLRGAVLSDAVLRGADLRGAVLSDAVLHGADLSDANLHGADLRDADLRGADLRDADLRGAVLRPIRADLYDVLVGARDEAPAFLAALRTGRVDGTCYEGECACLAGTIANLRGVSPYTLPGTDSSRPIERFLLSVKKGDTPETNPVARLVAEWTAAFVGDGA